jgi:hypothetical protein
MGLASKPDGISFPLFMGELLAANYERFEKLGYRRPFRRIGEKLLRLNRCQPHFRC